ncbi:MAG: tetratricopeptide repeat-containing sensor histidine kinase [Bacteroidales bacterium]
MKIAENTKNNIETLYVKADNYINTKVDSAIFYSNIGLSNIGNKDITNQFRFYGILRDAYEKQANTQKVIYYLNLMIKIAEERKDIKNLPKLYSRIGKNYGRTFAFDKAILYFHKSLETNKQLNDSIGISNSYKDLGLLYLMTNDTKTALINLQTSLNISLKIKDKKSTAFTLIGFGNVNSYLGNYKNAIKYQLWALKLFEELNEKKLVAVVLSNIGDAYISQKKYKIALEYFRRATKITNIEKYSKAYLLSRIGKTLLELNNYDSAYVYLKQAEVLGRNTNDMGFNNLNYIILSEYYTLKNDYKSALYYYKLSSDLKDSIYSNQSNERINQLKIKYEIDQFEAENQILKQKNEIQQLAIQKQTYLRNTFITISILIAVLVIFVFYRFMLKKRANKILFKKNRQISLQKTELEEAYATKEKLFAILTHDLKNPFGSLVSLCSFLQSNFYKLEDNHKYKGIESLKRSMGEIYYLLENLTDWLNTKGIENKSEHIDFDLFSTITSVLNLYRTSAEQKSLVLQMYVEPDTFAFGDERMIKTVLRNLIDNATKYTPANGKIYIQTKVENDKIIVSVKDTGYGIPDSIKQNLFNIEAGLFNGTGLGLVLSKEFIEKNNGKIWFESEVGNGSTFYFSIIKSNYHGKD